MYNAISYQVPFFRSIIQTCPTWYVILLCTFMGFNCTGLKYITDEDPLYKGSELNIQLEEKISLDLKYELKNVNRPHPNGKFLWMRPSIAIYNMMGNPKREKGIRSWIKNKIGKLINIRFIFLPHRLIIKKLFYIKIFSCL